MRPANALIATCTAVFFSLLGTGIAQTQIDTIYSTPGLDGDILSYDYLNEKYASTRGDLIAAGDYYSFFEGVMVLCRVYLDFDLSALPDSCRVRSALLWVYQEWVAGNNVRGVYPVWDIPGGDTLFCMVDHITYGETLDTLDWTAGDVGDSQTLHPKIGIISQDTTTEYKTMDVTEYVRDDLNSGRNRSQFRIAFDIQESDDEFVDYIVFGAAEQLLWDRYPPYLIITHDENAGVEEHRGARPSRFHLYQNYPNPFNLETVIGYELPVSGSVTLQVFDVCGRELRRLVDQQQSAGLHQITWDGRDEKGSDVPSGVYFCILQFGGGFQKTGKMILVR